MPRAIRRLSVLSGVALCAVLVGPVALAQASDNTLRATLNAYAPKIVKDEAAVKNGLVGYPQGKVKPLVRALNHEVSDLHALQHKLGSESASSAKGRKARRDIIKGLSLIAAAYTALRKDVQAAHGGAVSKSKVNAAVRTDKKGRAKLLAGLNLLK
ncbi:MAG: hypothetical protein JO130_03785 [Solirubrobacterales bacterium]|nr:hypothetical protein [Solirubrobacterales bacterium]